MDLNDAVQAVRTHWALAACVLALALGVAVLAWSLPGRAYEASTTVLVEPAGDRTDFGAVEATRSVWLPTVAEQVGTRSFRDAVARRLQPPAPADSFTLEGEFEGSSLILHVTASADDPVLARRAADAAAAAVQGRRISDAVRLRVIDAAETPTDPAGPGLGVHLIAGAAVGVIAGVLAALALAARRGRARPAPHDPRRVHGPERVAELTVLAEIPASPALASAGALPGRTAEPAVLAAFESLASAIEGALARGAVAITPAVGGDGASTVTACVALALAARGIPVTVVDADVRGPVMHTYLGVRNGSGLTDVTAGAGVADLLRETASTGLTVLPAGHPTGNGAAASLATTLPGVLDALGDRLVLIDTAAPATAPETAAVAGLSGAVVVVASTEHRGDVPAVVRSLEEAGAHVLGLVVTRVPSGVAITGAA